MNTSDLLGLTVGLTLGLAFALLQLRASIRAEKRNTTSRMAHVPGSMTRVAILLAALGAVQVLVPHANLWWITTGLIVAMLVPMTWRLRRMLQSR